MNNIFQTVFVNPSLNILFFFYKFFSLIKFPGAFGFAIISLTLLVRILFNPFFKKSIETAKKMQELKPHIDKLSKKYKNDAKRLQQEQLKLYQSAGINPASGCLVAIVQIPIMLGIYNALSMILQNGTGQKIIHIINNIVYIPFLKIQSIDPWFFGFNLALSPAKAHLWYYYPIPVITGLLQYLQVVYSTPKETKKDEAQKENSEKDGKEKKGSGEDFQKAMNMQMKFIFPIMIGVAAYSFPVGLSLYWNIFSIFSIIQYKNTYPNKILKPKF